MSSRRKLARQIVEPEFIVSREFFDRFFERPLPTSTFFDRVEEIKILAWPHMKGCYYLNASLQRLGSFVQALLVRKLLWERVPSDQIATVMSGRGTKETERMFLGGIEMVAKEEECGGARASGSSPPGATETWKRVWGAPGVELHLRDGLKKPGAADLKNTPGTFEKALRQAH